MDCVTKAVVQKYHFTGKRHKIQLENGIRLSISLSDLRIHIGGGAIPWDLTDSIKWVKKWLMSIRATDNYFKTDMTAPDKLNLSKLTVSRIDLAVNLVNPMNLDGLMLYTKNHKGMQRSSWSESGHTNGISWGKSGSQGVRLSVYEKWKSPNARFAIKKFGTSQFYRMEYNIGRKHLTRVENVYNVKDFSSYSDDITYKYPQRLDTCSDLLRRRPCTERS